ncbi:MAG: antitoxin VapB family protein [Candidatus Anstonellaceae archaeon]
MVKVISLSDEAYAILKRYKGHQMSFSDTVISHFKPDLAGKTEGTAELLAWIGSRKAGRRKDRLHAKIDEIVYGAMR